LLSQGIHAFKINAAGAHRLGVQRAT
jgi:hypothetical protein